MSLINDGINAALRMDTFRAMKKHREFPAGKTAVILVDAQRGLLGNSSDLLSKYKDLVEFSRLNKLQLIYTVFDPNAELAFPSRGHTLILEALSGEASKEIPAIAKPQSDDIVLEPRKTLSAVSKTKLLTILQSRNIEHVVLAGPLALTTLDSTMRDLAQEDFHLTILKSLVANPDNDAVENELKYTMRRYCHSVIGLKKFKKIVKKSNA